MRLAFVVLLGFVATVLETSRVVGQPAADLQEPVRYTVIIPGSSVPGTLTLTHLNPPPNGQLEPGAEAVLAIRCSVPRGFVMFFHLEGANAPGLPARRAPFRTRGHGICRSLSSRAQSSRAEEWADRTRRALCRFEGRIRRRL